MWPAPSRFAEVLGSLQPVEPRVCAVVGHEVRVRPGFLDTAVGQVENAVGHPHRREAMADEQGRAVAGQLLKALVHLVLGLHVERRGRLVQHQERAIAHEGARQRQFLPLAAG